MEQGIRIRTIVLLCLLLSGVLFTYAQNYSTWGEIYDYEIGDIFHFNEWGSAGSSGFSSMENIEVLNKTYSPDSSSVTYYQFVQRGTHLSEYPHYTFEEYYETVTYEDLDSVFIADSVYSNANYNYRKQSYYNISQPPYLTRYGRYVEGCGQAYQYWYQVDPPFMSTWERKLLYYKKGNEEWGTPHIVVSTEEFKGIENGVKCYPNPFPTSTTIKYELTEPSHVQLTIYNAIGETIHMAEDRMMPQGKHTFIWTADRLSEGLYYAVIRSEEGIEVVKMIKK